MARQYERYRPTYPDALIDDLATLRPARVVDVGCGTGKVAVGLAARGLSVLGVELDPRMAEVALGHGIPVEVGAFETWADAGRRFDLITCGAAWHWIDPELGMAKAADVLGVGGTIARFWNYHVLDQSVLAVIEAVYREHAPGAQPHGREPDDSGYLDPFAENEGFCSVETRSYRWERTLSADEWVGQAATFSDHQRLEPERLRTVARALHATIETLGGKVHAHGGTYLVLARRA